MDAQAYRDSRQQKPQAEPTIAEEKPKVVETVKVYAVRNSLGFFRRASVEYAVNGTPRVRPVVSWGLLEAATFKSSPLDYKPHASIPGEEVVEVQLTVIREVPHEEMRRLAGGRE